MDISRSLDKTWVSVYRVYRRALRTLFERAQQENTHWFIRIPSKLMCLEDQHVQKGSFSMMKMADHCYITNHLWERRHVQ